MSQYTSKREIKDMSEPFRGAGNIFDSSTGGSSDPFGSGEKSGGDLFSGGEKSGGDLFGGGEKSGGDLFGGGEKSDEDLFGGEEKSGGDLFGGEEKSGGDLFGGGDSKSCFSTPKRLTRQYANPPSLKKKSILDDKKEYTLESPEGKEILNHPGEVKEVDGKTIVFNSTCPWEQDAYIVLSDTNPLTNTVKAMHNNLMKQRKTSRETENMLNQEINAVKKHGLETLAKQEYVLKKKHAHEDYARKRRRISTDLYDEFTKATGYSTFGDFGSGLFK